jgi:hypothetical protein
VHSREAGEQEAGTGGFLLLASFLFYLLATIYLFIYFLLSDFQERGRRGAAVFFFFS